MRLLTLAIFLLLSGLTHAQDPIISVVVTTKDDGTGKKLAGSVVKIYSGGKLITSKTAASNGKVPPIDLEVGPVYEVHITKPGYVTKVAQIDSHFDYIEDLQPITGFPMEVGLFQTVDGVDFSWLENTPMIKYQLDAGGMPDYDPQYTKQMLKRIQELKDEMAKKQEEEANKQKQFDAFVAAGDKANGKEDYEAAIENYDKAIALIDDPDVKAKRDAAQKAWDEKKAGAETEKKFQEKMKQAQDQLTAKNYEEALKLFKEAADIKPSEQLPKDKIKEIEDILAKQKAQEEEFNKFVADGDKAMGSEDYDNAITNYESALGIKDDAGVKAKLEDAKKKKADKEAADQAEKEKQAQYDDLIAQADKLFDSEKYEDARSRYQEALDLKPNESHPSARISEIDGILKKMQEEADAAKKLEEDYNKFISDGDAAFDSKNWQEAINKYKEALKLKPGEKHPTDRISEAQKNLDNEAAQKELDEKYAALIADAKGLFDGQKYEEAKAKYKEALDLKPDESEPKDKIAEIDKILADMADEAEKEEKYLALMAEGQSFQSGEDYKSALTKYEEALGVKPGDSEAQKKIDEVKKLIADQEAAKEQEEKFNEFVASGDKDFGDKDYESAKSNYQKALDIKDDQTVKDKIAEIDEILQKQGEEAELQAKYDAAIKSADDLFSSDNWEDAKAKYEEASGLKPDESYPKERIAKINEKLAELADNAEKEQQFNDLVAEAEGLADKEDYAGAIKKYQEAIKIKPDPTISKRILELEELKKKNEDQAAVQEAYDKKIEEADKAFNSSDWANAKALYQEAVDIKSDEQYPKDKIAEIDKKIQEEADAAVDAEYQAMIEKADGFRDQESFDDAIASYEKAKKIKPTETYPQEQIDKINEIKAQRDKEQMQAEEFEQKYNDLIAQADEAFNTKDYSGALAKYKEAIAMKPDEAHPKGRISEIEEILAQLDADAALMEKYKSAVEAADKLFNDGSYKEAKTAYQEALDIKGDEQYPKDQIALCDQKMQEQSGNEEEAQYQKILTTAQKYFDEKNYDKALELYNRALTIRPDDSIPKDKIEEINKILADLAANKELMEKYDAAIAKADQLFNDGSYKDAKVAYQDAIDIKGDEQYPKDQIVLCDEKMQAESQGEEEAQYQKILTTAQKYLDEKNYDKALDLYNRALSIRPDDSVPKEKIEEINKILADLAAQKELQEKYDAAIAKADQLFGEENFKDAKTAYQDALDIISTEQYPKDQIALCDQKMQEQSGNEEEEQYQKILTTAKKYFDEKNYEKALNLYNRALTIRPDDSVPLDMIAEINKILANLASQKELQDRYDAAIAKADQLFGEENFKDAKTAYQDALDIIGTEQYPKDQIAICDQKMQSQSENEEEAQYQKILQVAQKKFDEKDYERALELYERAKSIRPSDPLPQQRIDEINQILKDLESEKEKRQRFDELIQQADTYFERKEWKNAMEKYMDALDLFVEQYPKDQVERCREGMKISAGDSADKQYNKLIKKADEYFNAKNYDKAKGLYKRAVKLKPSDQYPKDQLKAIEAILNKPVKLIADGPDMKDYGKQTNERSIDIEAMMAEAEEASRYYGYKKIFDKRDEAADALTEFSEAGKEETFNAKDEVEGMEIDIDEAKEGADLGRQDTRDNVDEWQLVLSDIDRTRTEYNENDVQFQNKKVEAINTEVQDLQFDSDKPREQFEMDVEKIKLEVKNEDVSNATDQTDVIMEDKENINTVVENHVVHDANNDLHRKNTEVEVEDFQVRVLNKNNEDIWDQEDMTMDTKQDVEYLEEDIIANQMDDDVPREENVEIVDKITISYEDREKEDIDSQVDENYDVKDNTEVMVKEIQDNFKDKDDTREEYEDVVEEVTLSYEDRENEDIDSQVDETYDVKDDTEVMVKEIQDNFKDKDDTREEYEDVVEEVTLSYEDRENEDIDSQEDQNQDVKADTEVMVKEIQDNFKDKDDTREEYEDVVEEVTLSYEDREKEDIDSQEDQNQDVKADTEVMVKEIQDNFKDKDDTREEYEDVVEEVTLSYEDRENKDIDSQVDQNQDVKADTEEMMEEINENFEGKDKDREGYEEKVEEVTMTISEYNDDLTSKNEDNGQEMKEYTEKITDKQVDIDEEMDDNANKQADATNDAIEDHIEHIGDNELENQVDLESNMDYVEDLKDLDPNTITPEMENRLGEKFPEGVTEESYTINDSNGLLKAYVIRRVVVIDGVGKVYEKTQTRYGHLTYTRNGEPITEYQWDNETSASNVTKN
jgi:tetratricopeptide (TPR) repeat protein